MTFTGGASLIIPCPIGGEKPPAEPLQEVVVIHEEQPRRSRPVFLIALLILVSCAVVLLLYAILTRVIVQPSGWRAQVDDFLGYRSGLTYLSASPATRPAEFSAQMSGATYGDSVYYQTDFHRRSIGGPRPLPYPPDEVWCVTLAATRGGTTTVFVARHVDLYNADWIIHEPAGNPAQVMAQIGCR